ncbi:hypothetical protein COLO4_30629 [Corchorus olitorius]|uniref:TF-B3 domain-containing protein n=1 Tax=Corchorus olitorius TaxID=93759 RepID=A0A1R3H7K0_9ROSI|nr:hypothetical protein COLO4_30629 [Corchorus olitorius]
MGHHHFFKIVLEDAIQEGKLEIPPKFAREYGNALSSPVFLKVPTGAEWQVELAKRDGKIWLENGWDNFARHYSLKHGYFLVFRLEGNSHFHVLIFDKTASEIKYPNPNQNDKAIKIEEYEEENSIQIIAEISPGRREKSQWQCGRPYKRPRTNPSYEKPKSAPGKRVGKSTTVCNFRQLSSCEKSKVLERAGFNSDNPYFILVMHPTQIIKYCLSIPSEFARKYLKNRGEVFLSNSGKTWSANYYSCLNPNKQPYVKLRWVTFVQDNKLKVGDICAFELINRIEMSFKVFIDRGHQKAEFQGTSTTHLGSHGLTLQIARAFKSENPFFVVNLAPSSIHRYALVSHLIIISLDFYANFAHNILNYMLLEEFASGNILLFETLLF